MVDEQSLSCLGVLAVQMLGGSTFIGNTSSHRFLLSCNTVAENWIQVRPITLPLVVRFHPQPPF